MLKKKWIVKKFDEAQILEMSKKYNISPLMSIIMYNRGISDSGNISKFLIRDLKNLHNPFLMKDMDKAVERIKKAIKNSEKITIYGDYDVDGITSVAILHKHLTGLGVEADYYIPGRMEEGYGINTAALDNIKESGTTLIITVDTGITAYSEAEYAKSIGIDMVITDHHECKEQIPDVCAAIDPKQKDCNYPFKNLAGVGVTFKLIQALENNSNPSPIIKEYADLISLGTVADIAPLVDENRILVTEGLKMFSNTKNTGLRALLDVAASGVKNITTGTIGYIIAPRINASGRLGCANRSVELFLTNDSIRALELANDLCRENTVRQQTEQRMFKEALDYIEQNPHILNDKILVIPHENWHHGIIGIVSSKITEKYYKPSILLTTDDEEGKGSGRSISGFNLFGALEYCNDFLLKYGGHELAAGLSIKSSDVDEFRRKINEYAENNFDDSISVPSISVDAIIKAPYITIDTVMELNKLQPFGVENPAPTFAMRNLKIHRISVMSEGKHLRMTLLKDGKYFDTVGFNMGECFEEYQEGDYIDVVFGLDVNDYRGFQNVQLLLKDLRITEQVSQ